MKRYLILIALVVASALVAFSIVVNIGYAPFAERKRDADRVFQPMLDLNPSIFRNAFGVYVVEFNSESNLSDDNALRLLQLNRLPDKYDLTLVIETPSITDASVSILSKLDTTDAIIARDSGLTDAGLANLAEMLPDGSVPARDDPTLTQPR